MTSTPTDPRPGSAVIDEVAAAHTARLAAMARPFRFVHICAPTGFGKSRLATKIATDAGTTVARVRFERDATGASCLVDTCRALFAAWPDGPNTPDEVSELNAAKLLDSCLQVIGATTLVFDGADHLDDDAFDELLGRLVDTDSLRIAIASTAMPSPLLTSLEAAGRLIRIDATSLEFSRDQCGAMVGGEAEGRELFDATAGWPVAVLLRARIRDRGSRGRDDSLLRLFLKSHPEFVRPRMAVAARLDRVPAMLVDWMRPSGSERRGLGAESLLVEPVDDAYSFRRWARDALRDGPLDSSAVVEALVLLRDAADDDTRFTLAVEVGHVDDVLAEIEQFCATEVASGGHRRVRRLIERIPVEHRTIDLRVSAVLAEQATTDRRAPESDLRELVRLARHDDQPSPRANVALANHYRMVGDPAVVQVCHDVVAPLLGLSPDDAASAARDLWPNPPDRVAAAELLRFLGHGTMLSTEPGSLGAGREMVRAALRIMHDEQSIRSQQGWLLYIEALMFVQHPAEVVFHARTIAVELWRSRHSDAPLRLAELAILEFFTGLRDRCRSTIEMAREAADATGNDLALLPLNAIELVLDILDEPSCPDRVDDFERAIFAMLDHDFLAVFHQIFASEFGLIQLELGNVSTAERFNDIAARSPTTFMSASFSLRQKRLDALLRRQVDDAQGRHDLGELRTLAARLERQVLVDLIDRDLGDASPDSDTGGDPSDDDALEIIALAPLLTIKRGGQDLPTPTGYTARLLALLIASSGTVAIEVALEALWPDSDPKVSRNRLHGVLLRLRRALGCGPDGPITCRDELLKLAAGPQLTCDAWELEAAITAGRSVDPQPDLLSEQFRYDDRVSEYREYLGGLVARATTEIGITA